ncbi:Hypothetical predicted protein [Xyrichtys novacula]|uniref:Uncharacterized protein n=1 Tax=Xyrichtys novacula TaxID=13765 RepID=A0AAV1H6W6_XYRNO|nr:Hypothetical predicted protein [Xyrichtys novacula]
MRASQNMRVQDSGLSGGRRVEDISSLVEGLRQYLGRIHTTKCKSGRVGLEVECLWRGRRRTQAPQFPKSFCSICSTDHEISRMAFCSHVLVQISSHRTLRHFCWM